MSAGNPNRVIEPGNAFYNNSIAIVSDSKYCNLVEKFFKTYSHVID